jgi:hypothetical protein
MKKSIVTIGFALIALAAFPAANASEDSEYEREGWAALEAAQASDFNFVAPAQ